MFENSLIIAGKIVKPPVRSISPAGVPHCHFVLEHVSQQYEAQMPRRVWCRIKVVASGLAMQQQTEILQSESNIRVHGFIQRQESANGIAQLVLHAQNIEKLD
ncbi:primosomal replication protein N [Catenovulum sediminis]|uniref:Replication restart protein PriB n=1 Tax=Catenovulum sediminis TaxID=1740262 RepID=A0ABV1RN89_9ALTE|nr:primosomal replication protein N [Catenovulum sediminis]